MNLSYRSVKTEVRPSPIHGQGLFCSQAIARGEIIAIKGGAIIPAKQWQTEFTHLQDAEIQIDENFFIGPTTRESRSGSMLYMNHSCDPNSGVAGQIIFVAMRDIEVNEEITHDWATTDDLQYQIKCNCASPHCRGVITGKDWKLPELQEKYKGWFSWFLQRKIDAMRADVGQSE